MLLCDGCCKKAEAVFKITTNDTEQAKWSMCWDCVKAVMGVVMTKVDNLTPRLRDACPSLTPDQSRQVEAYLARLTNMEIF